MELVERLQCGAALVAEDSFEFPLTRKESSAKSPLGLLCGLSGSRSGLWVWAENNAFPYVPYKISCKGTGSSGGGVMPERESAAPSGGSVREPRFAPARPMWGGRLWERTTVWGRGESRGVCTSRVPSGDFAEGESDG